MGSGLGPHRRVFPYPLQDLHDCKRGARHGLVAFRSRLRNQPIGPFLFSRNPDLEIWRTDEEKDRPPLQQVGPCLRASSTRRIYRPEIHIPLGFACEKKTSLQPLLIVQTQGNVSPKKISLLDFDLQATALVNFPSRFFLIIIPVMLEGKDTRVAPHAQCAVAKGLWRYRYFSATE